MVMQSKQTGQLPQKAKNRGERKKNLFITYFAFTLFENLSINNLNFNYISLYLHHVVRYHTQF